MTILKIGLIAVVGCIVLAVLKNTSSSYILLIQIALIGLIFISVVPDFKELFSLLEAFPLYDAVGKGSVTVLFKTFSLLIVGAVVGDICRDNGESAVAGVVELAVKIMSIVLAVPVLSAVVGVAISFIGN